jgi:hypothetical protein
MPVLFRRIVRLLALVLLFLSSTRMPAFAQRGAPPADHPGSVGTIQGKVTTQGGTIELGGAVVSVSDGGAEVSRVFSNGDGTFHFDNLKPGQYKLMVSIEGFDPLTTQVTVAAGQTTSSPVDLKIAMVAESVEVTAPEPVVPSAGTLSSTDTVGSKELEQIVPGGGLQAALRLLVSVIQVPGGVAIKGGRPSQASVQLGPGIFVDPATGLTQGSLPDDAIERVTVLPNPYAVEFGRFSSGLVLIQTRRAADEWKTRLNELEPSFRTDRHQPFDIVGLGSFSPRIESGGPLVKDRLFLQTSAQYSYHSNDIASRPQSEIQTSHRFSSFTRADANLTDRHSLVVVGGFFPSVAKFANLGTFTPPEATVDTHNRVVTAGATERAVWRDTLFSETTFEMNRYRVDVNPQSTGPMQLFPETTLGSFFNTQQRMTSTYQVIETLSGSTNGARGLHLYKFGVDVLRNEFDARSSSQPVFIYRSAPTLTLARRIDYGPSGLQTIGSTDLALFAQDRWQPNSRWYLEFGGRIDRDGVIDRFNVTPRAGAAFLLTESGSAVLRSGYGLFYERTPSAAGVFNEYETPTDTRYALDGVTPLAPPAAYHLATAPDLRTPRSATWDVAYDHRFNVRWAIHIASIIRHGSHELIVQPVAAGPASQLLLESDGRSDYREIEIGTHFTQGSFADANVSYVRSRAHSDLNAFTNFFDAVRSPVFGTDAYAPARSDAPNRLLARGRLLPTPRWLFVGVLDWRSGLPYSNVNEFLDFVGPRNSLRLPSYFRVDLGLDHRFKFGKYQPWIGLRADNALNSWLPSDAQANISSPAYGTFYNGEYRRFRIQVRFER